MAVETSFRLNLDYFDCDDFVGDEAAAAEGDAEKFVRNRLIEIHCDGERSWLDMELGPLTFRSITFPFVVVRRANEASQIVHWEWDSVPML